MDNVTCDLNVDEARPSVPEADQPRFYEAQQILGEYLGRAFYGEIDGKTAVIESAKEAEELLANP